MAPHQAGSPPTVDVAVLVVVVPSAAAVPVPVVVAVDEDVGVGVGVDDATKDQKASKASDDELAEHETSSNENEIADAGVVDTSAIAVVGPQYRAVEYSALLALVPCLCLCLVPFLYPSP